MFKYIWREVMELINEPKNYLSSFWNMMDITSIILNMYYIISIYTWIDSDKIDFASK